MRVHAGREVSVSGVRVFASDAHRPRGGKRVVRLVMRFVLLPLMLGFGTYTFVNGGLQGLVALFAILVAQVVAFLVIYPLWTRYRRRRTAAQTFED